jgi:DNA-binding protein HU-beta
MTKSDLISAVATASNLSKRVTEEVLNATFDSLAEALKKSERVQVPGFGTFCVKARKARNGSNPPTGATTKLKASRTVGFKPAANLKKAI